MVARQAARVPHQASRGARLRCGERKLVRHDPRRHAILACIRRSWRHVPRRGVLLFFDVQPIPVKADGGRRLTAARRLMLEKAQKTRGFFYLVAA